MKLPAITAKFTPILDVVKKYLLVVFLLFFAGIYGFLLFRIETLANAKPDEDAILEKLKTVQRPRLDEAAAKKIQSLEDQNISVQTLFDQARQNPFAE